MNTIAFIKENTWLGNKSNHGWGNGYVAISKEYFLYGFSNTAVFFNPDKYNGIIDVNLIEYNDKYKTLDISDLVSVHFGLTFSGTLKDVLSDNIEYVDDGASLSESDDYWVFGFDTCHCYDNQINCNKDFVIAETKNLETQLRQITEDYIKELLNK